ncbi:MAG: hypothetical protein AAGA97_00435 [Pseudomonadota bacterium]
MNTDALIAAFQAEQLAPLHKKKAHIERRMSELVLHNSPETVLDAEMQAKEAKRAIERMLKSVENHLKNFADIAHQSERHLREVQISCGEFRKPRFPDRLATAASLAVFWTVEAVLTGLTLVADGTAEPITGLAFGGMFAGANIGLGCMAGFMSRYIDYRIKSPVRSHMDEFKRRLASTVCAVCVAGGAFMHLVAGRVRAVGDHEHIFDFSKVGFFGTFNDALGLCIMVVAALSFGVAMFKGRSGLTEKRPELCEIDASSRGEIDAEAEDLVDDALEQFDDLLHDTEDAFLAASPLPDDASAIEEQVAELGADISAAKDRVRIFADKVHSEQSFVEGEMLPMPSLDFGELDALSIKKSIPQPVRPKRELLDALRTAHADGSAGVSEAHAAYLASVQGFRFSPPKSATTP